MKKCQLNLKKLENRMILSNNNTTNGSEKQISSILRWLFYTKDI